MHHPQSTLFNLGIIPILDNSTQTILPKIITDSFQTLQTRTASEVVAFGAEHISANSSFQLAIKFIDSCGTWTFRTGNVKDTLDIEMSDKTCPGVLYGLATFPETCEKNQRFTIKF